MRDDPDLNAWEPEEPPRGFAERVVAEAMRDAERERTRARSRRAGVALVAMLAAAAAIVLALTPSRSARTASGSAIAADRTEVPLGARAVAVLEPGAEVSWTGDDVMQVRGNVFYRVERGAEFRVHTSAGDVTVKGTCFRVKLREESEMGATGRDVKVGAAGALIATAVFVGVYEGKVALSRAKASVDVTAGQSARADASGVRPTGDLARGERLFDGAAAEAKDDPLVAANASLADSVRLYKTRLEQLDAEKKKLQLDLADVQKKLAAEQDGSAAMSKSEFDLSQDDWKQLAKEGGVKMRVPCKGPSGFEYGAGSLKKLGLPPQDGPIIAKAMEASYKRTWDLIRPLCADAIGGADLADRIGRNTCRTLIVDVASQKDGPASEEAVRRVAEIRAGERPMPGPNDPMSPVERMMLALTGETKLIEAELAQSLGPEEAHRITFAEEGCWDNQFSVVGPRPPQQ
jgi:hypothetical protein